MADNGPFFRAVSEALSRRRPQWLTDVFNESGGRKVGSNYHISNEIGGAGDSLKIPLAGPAPAARTKRLKDFGKGQWCGDDLALFTSGNRFGMDMLKGALKACQDYRLGVAIPPELNGGQEPPRRPPPKATGPIGGGMPRPPRSNGSDRPIQPNLTPAYIEQRAGEILAGIYPFPDRDGHDCFRTERWLRQDGSKRFRQFVHSFNAYTGNPGVVLPTPRPVYNADRLANAPKGSLVLIVEGEGCADTGGELGYLTITSAGGSSQAKLSDWQDVEGDDPVIWPDNDQPGSRYRDDVIELVGALGCRPRIVQIPDGKPEGWDITDALAEGMPALQIHALIQSAKSIEPPRPEGAAEAIVGIDWLALEGITPPPRKYVIDGMLPRGDVTSLYGEGGAGKSLLVQQLTGNVLMGYDFLGHKVTRGNVLLINAEERDVELWRRQVDINRFLSIRMADIAGRVIMQGRKGMQCGLAEHPRGMQAKPLPFLQEIEDVARGLTASLIVLDNRAHLYLGDQNDPVPVTGFLNLLEGLALRLDCAVLLLGHPPKNDSEYSGTVAWRNQVRSLWTLAKVDEPDEQGRKPVLLTINKANHGPEGEQNRLKWDAGVMRWQDEPDIRSGMERKDRAHNAKRVFINGIRELRKQPRATSAKSFGQNYAPKLIVEAGFAEGFKKEELAKAMNDLLKEGVIEAEGKLWQRDDRHWQKGVKVVADE